MCSGDLWGSQCAYVSLVWDDIAIMIAIPRSRRGPINDEIAIAMTEQVTIASQLETPAFLLTARSISFFLAASSSSPTLVFKDVRSLIIRSNFAEREAFSEGSEWLGWLPAAVSAGPP